MKIYLRLQKYHIWFTLLNQIDRYRYVYLFTDSLMLDMSDKSKIL